MEKSKDHIQINMEENPWDVSQNECIIAIYIATSGKVARMFRNDSEALDRKDYNMTHGVEEGRFFFLLTSLLFSLGPSVVFATTL